MRGPTIFSQYRSVPHTGTRASSAWLPAWRPSASQRNRMDSARSHRAQRDRRAPSAARTSTGAPTNTLHVKGKRSAGLPARASYTGAM